LAIANDRTANRGPSSQLQGAQIGN
jgi:hypothetical protein